LGIEIYFDEIRTKYWKHVMLMGLVTSFWLYFRRKQLCDAQVCQMQGKRWNVTALAFSTVLMSVVTYVDFFLVSL